VREAFEQAKCVLSPRWSARGASDVAHKRIPELARSTQRSDVCFLTEAAALRAYEKKSRSRSGARNEKTDQQPRSEKACDYR